MSSSDPVCLVPRGARVEADPTPGMTRERAVEVAGCGPGSCGPRPV